MAEWGYGAMNAIPKGIVAMPLRSLSTWERDLMPDDPAEARYWIASIDRRLGSIEAKGEATARDVSELKVSMARQDSVLDRKSVV